MLTHEKQFDLLKGLLLKQCSGKKVYYFANPGNWGDALIHRGTLKFLAAIGLKYELLPEIDGQVTVHPHMKGAILIYGGSGAWCDTWNHAACNLISAFHPLFSELIVLPSTYKQHYAIPKATFFCRDLCESRTNMPQAVFCHDMAFYIGPIASPAGQGTGRFFRTDNERSSRAVYPTENDLSLQGTHLSDTAPFIASLARYSIIHTDRLHIAIAGCLLRREVHLYPGAYFKNRALYLSSIKGYFDNVYFHEH